MHPAAALFERPFSLAGAAEEHRAYVRLLESEGACVHTLVGALLLGTLDAAGEPLPGPALTELQDFALRCLAWDVSALPAREQAVQRAAFEPTVRALDPRDLVRIILLRPTVRLRSTEGLNTGLAATYEMAPVMNLYFMRDPMITTAKGVVLGRMNSEQRRVETEIAAFALRRLGITPVLTISGEGRLEGGDFLPAGDTAFIGQGLRTNAEAVRQMLAADAFGAARVVVVKDPWQNQEQMHLDTYFNIAGPDVAVLVEERMTDPGRRPTVDVYEKRGAAYEQVLAGADFREYVEGTLGFTVIPVSGADQLRYGINFLTVAPRRVLAVDGVSESLKERLRAHGIAATWMDFGNLTGGYGAAHCTTQVLRRVP